MLLLVIHTVNLDRPRAPPETENSAAQMSSRGVADGVSVSATPVTATIKSQRSPK